MIDHLLWAVPDLEAGCRSFARQNGVTPSPGGRHPGVGTHNALADLGGGRYLEVIAPDPTQDRLTGLGRFLAGLERESLITWCARADELGEIADRARRAGLRPGEPVAMSRRRDDGVILHWRILELGGHPWGPLVPFFIEWGPGVPHPSESAARGLQLKSLHLAHPNTPPLHDVLVALNLEPVVAVAGRPALRATLETPRGPLQLASRSR